MGTENGGGEFLNDEHTRNSFSSVFARGFDALEANDADLGPVLSLHVGQPLSQP